MATFKTLLKVNVEHDFYTNGACSCLNFYATDKTFRLFENTGLLLKNTSHGIQIVYDESRLEALRLYATEQDEPLCFEFKVYSTEPEFRSYTSPFAEVADDILYFDNHATTLGVANYNLSASEYVSVNDLKKLDSNELKGIIDHKERLLPPVFVVKIFAQNEQGSLLEQWLKPTATTYSIAFNARETFWKYYLLGKMAKETSYIVDSDHNIEFEALGSTTLSDESVAFTFRSMQKIPFNEHYSFRFQLKEKSVGSEHVLINRLPVACVTQTGLEQEKIISEIYINS